MTVLVDTSLLAGTAGATGVEGSFAVSVVTVGELRLGILVAGTAPVRASRLARLTAIVENTTVLPVDDAVASQYAELRAATGRLPTNDLWIAATAAAYKLILVTGDERQSKLPGLRTRYVPYARHDSVDGLVVSHSMLDNIDYVNQCESGRSGRRR